MNKYIVHVFDEEEVWVWDLPNKYATIRDAEKAILEDYREYKNSTYFVADDDTIFGKYTENLLKKINIDFFK